MGAEMNFVGYKFATENGFTLHSHSGDRTSAWYVDDTGIFLQVNTTERGELQYELSFTHKMLTCKIGEFSIPNSNFPNFYRQMRTAQYKLNQEM